MRGPRLGLRLQPLERRCWRRRWGRTSDPSPHRGRRCPGGADEGEAGRENRPPSGHAEPSPSSERLRRPPSPPAGRRDALAPVTLCLQSANLQQALKNKAPCFQQLVRFSPLSSRIGGTALTMRFIPSRGRASGARAIACGGGDRCGTPCVALGRNAAEPDHPGGRVAPPSGVDKGLSSGLKRRSPGALVAPARPGFVSKGPKWREVGGRKLASPDWPCDARPETLGSRDHAERRRRRRKLSNGPRNAKAGGHIGSGPTRPRSATSPPFPAAMPGSDDPCLLPRARTHYRTLHEHR